MKRSRTTALRNPYRSVSPSPLVAPAGGERGLSSRTSKVKDVLVNIFGGIAKCDTIAEALIAAAKEIGFKIPVVVRLEGTNVDRARLLLKDAAIPQLIPATDLTDAAEKVCRQVA